MSKELTPLDLYKRACGQTAPQTDLEVRKKFDKLLKYPIEGSSNSEEDQRQEDEDMVDKNHESDK